MDNYETSFPDQEPESIPQTPPAANPVEPPKASPFADSPYITNQQSQDSYSHWQREAPYTSAEAPKATKKRSGRVWKSLLSGALVLALVAAGCGLTAFGVNHYWESQLQAQNSKTDQVLNQLNDKIAELQQQIRDNSYTGNGNSISGSTNTNADGMTPGQLYSKCVSSVVAITNQMITAQGESTSSGSGFIISEDGYILTNYHVVADTHTLTVTTYDGTEYTAALKGYDDTNDLALLKIEATGLPAATLGSSSDLIVGDQVVAIGNPLGELTSTLTVGYVSAKERDVSTDGTIINMLQTDAAINPGNSGGPLFNMKGEVVGITTAKYSGTTSSGASIEGIGFAIPIDDVAEKIQQLMTDGYVSTPYLGVYVDNRYNGLGAYVISVEPDGSAAAAGVQAKDIIIGLGDREISSIDDISKALRGYKVGDTTTITVYRNRSQVELSITLGQKPRSDTDSTQEPADGTDPTFGQGQMPSDGSFDDWFDYFFGGGNG